jgi:D-3-phosphoglycerate dehydrogenase
LAALSAKAHIQNMDTLTPLICDLLEWLAREPRTHAEVMDGWRTSCPRLPVWEEANARGLITRFRGDGGVWLVHATAAGRAFVARARA